MKLVPFFLKKYDLYVVAVIESYLFKYSSHNYNQTNTRNLDKMDGN